VADTACADIWTRLALIDTRNFTTLISPSASISAFNLDLQLGRGAPDRRKNYHRRDARLRSRGSLNLEIFALRARDPASRLVILAAFVQCSIDRDHFRLLKERTLFIIHKLNEYGALCNNEAVQWNGLHNS